MISEKTPNSKKNTNRISNFYFTNLIIYDIHSIITLLEVGDMRRKRIIAIYTGIIAAVALLATDHLGLDLGKSMFIVVVTVIAGNVLMEKFIK